MSREGRSAMKVMAANRTREMRPSGMKRGACGIVSVRGAGLRAIGKPIDTPPDPTMLMRRISISTKRQIAD